MFVNIKYIVYILTIITCVIKAQELTKEQAVPVLEKNTKKPVETTAAPKSLNKNEEYHEELVVQPLASGFINTYFQFTTRWFYGKRENCKYFSSTSMRYSIIFTS